MTSHERISLALAHKEPDRIPRLDGFWGTTVERWKKEGSPQDKSLSEYFEFDKMYGVGVDISFQFPSEVIEDTDEYRITRSSWGVVAKNFKGKTSVPIYIDFAVKDRKSWEENRWRLAYNESRVNFETAKSVYQKARQDGAYLNYSGGGLGFDLWQNVVGVTNILIGMMDDPEWVKELYMTNVDLHITLVEELMGRGLEFDGSFFTDDLGYVTGPFFSPEIYKEQLFPAHKKLCDFLHGKGIKVILHSCGGVRPFVPYFIEAGFDCLNPLEVKAGMDLVELKGNFGDRLSFFGGIDVRAMANPDPKVIEEEVKTKVTIAKKNGGYIYHSDHSVPDNVSFQQYQRMMELVREYGRYREI